MNTHIQVCEVCVCVCTSVWPVHWCTASSLSLCLESAFFVLLSNESHSTKMSLPLPPHPTHLLSFFLPSTHPFSFFSLTSGSRPQNGSMILYNRKKVKYRKDGYCWKKRKDGKTTREDHMKLKVQGVEVRPFVRAVKHTNPSLLWDHWGA